ncbi:MAG TPA: nucleotidyltransferase [Bacillota bacterium]|nr:nucleotidyltransferase [Bacillota bacterium]
MKVVGLIVEYNPLHNGHLHHFQQSLQATGANASVAVMSGFFLQRGEPALVGKWARAQMALALGVDLVLELPLAYCTQNAEWFAFGAISTLHNLGIVDYVCFGSESGELSWIHSLADCLQDEPHSFKQKIKELLALGLSYPKAYASAISSSFNIPEKFIEQPNNILGLNYVLALKRLQSKIQPATVIRTKADYHQESITDQRIASATAIRKQLLEKTINDIIPYVPKTTYEILSQESQAGRCPVTWNHFYPFLMANLATKSESELAEIYGMDEGLEYRLKREFLYSHSFQELMERIKTKRYTWNRLQRLFLYTLLNIKEGQVQSFNLDQGVPYIRVLGFNSKGRELLHLAKKLSPVPILTKIPKTREAMLELDIRASTIYQLGCPQPFEKKQYNQEFYMPPIIV